jgi:hypothetical protein
MPPSLVMMTTPNGFRPRFVQLICRKTVAWRYIHRRALGGVIPIAQENNLVDADARKEKQKRAPQRPFSLHAGLLTCRSPAT